MKNLKNKVDAFLWAFIWLIPFFAFFVSWFRIGSAPDLITFINGSFSFDYIKDLLDNVWSTCFNGSSLPLSGYISYLVGVEVIHCFFDAIVFIPRFCHEVVERSCNLWRKEK